jgi:hypothetical protein
MAQSAIQVTVYSIDGVPGASAELIKDAQGSLRLDDQPVLAVSPWHDRVALTLPGQLVVINAEDYGRLWRTAEYTEYAEEMPL